jgi:hypothetical protein
MEGILHCGYFCLGLWSGLADPMLESGCWTRTPGLYLQDEACSVALMKIDSLMA